MNRVLDHLRLETDLFPRILAWAVRHCPFYLETIFVPVYAALFFLIAGPPRRAVANNLKTILPHVTPLERFLGAYRVILNFAWTCVDAARARDGQSAIDWEVEGVDIFDKVANSPDGVVVMTAHMGNYDLAAPVFASRFKKKLNAVRAPEKNEELQDFRKKELQRDESEEFAVAYNAPGNLLGVDLLRALGNGEAVAIQGDRVMFDVAAGLCRFGPAQLRIPSGPFLLAMMAKVQVLPIFIVRIGYRRYRVICKETFSVKRESRNREAGMAKAMDCWGEILESVVRAHWDQWSVFEPAFVKEEMTS